jgi:hydrogenase expression/formation protein HypC
MCLGVPARVERIEGERAEVSYGSVRAEVSVALLREVQVGDFVIVHAGFAIERVDQAEAEETLRILGGLHEA